MTVSSCGFSRTAAWMDGSAGLHVCGSIAAANSATDPASNAPRATRSTNRSEMNEGTGRGRTSARIPAPGDGPRTLTATDQAVEATLAVPGSVVVVSLGFDTYGLDPIGDFALTTDVYHEVGRRVAAIGRRLVILQGGGYHRPSLGENARAWLRGTEGRPVRAAARGRVHRGRFGRRVTLTGEVLLRPEGHGESSAVRDVVAATFDDVTVAR